MKKRFLTIIAVICSLSFVSCMNTDDNASTNTFSGEGMSISTEETSSVSEDDNFSASSEENASDSSTEEEVDDSSEEAAVSTKVTEDVWKTIFAKENWENVTMTGKMDDLIYSGGIWEIEHVIKIDGELGLQIQHSDISEHCVTINGEIVSSEVLQKEYNYTEYCFKKDGVYSSYWIGSAGQWHERAPEVVYNADMIASMLAFTEYYSSFTYNEDNQSYEGANIVCSNRGFVIKYATVELKFENNQLKSMNVSLAEPLQTALQVIAMSYEFTDFGATEITIPDINLA